MDSLESMDVATKKLMKDAMAERTANMDMAIGMDCNLQSSLGLSYSTFIPSVVVGPLRRGTAACDPRGDIDDCSQSIPAKHLQRSDARKMVFAMWFQPSERNCVGKHIRNQLIRAARLQPGDCM